MKRTRGSGKEEVKEEERRKKKEERRKEKEERRKTKEERRKKKDEKRKKKEERRKKKAEEGRRHKSPTYDADGLVGRSRIHASHPARGDARSAFTQVCNEWKK